MSSAVQAAPVSGGSQPASAATPATAPPGSIVGTMRVGGDLNGGGQAVDFKTFMASMFANPPAMNLFNEENKFLLAVMCPGYFLYQYIVSMIVTVNTLEDPTQKIIQWVIRTIGICIYLVMMISAMIASYHVAGPIGCVLCLLFSPAWLIFMAVKARKNSSKK